MKNDLFPDITITDALELLDSLDPELREELLKRMLEFLTPYSHKAILQYQLDWDGNTSLEEFIAGQNIVINQCLLAELSPFGCEVRKKNGYELLTFDSKIFSK